MKANLPKEVDSLLTWWLPRVKQILGTKLRCVKIGGSVALGDFSPLSSDVDVYVVVSKTLSDDESREVGRVHDVMRECFIEQCEGGWRSHELMEAHYMPYELAGETTTAMRYFSVRTNSALWGEWRLSPFSRYVAARYGLHYCGEHLALAQPDRRGLIEQILRQTRSWESPSDRRLSDAAWMAGQIQLMARSITFLRDGSVLSKTVALRREIDSGSPFAAAYETALLFREHGLAWADQHLERIREGFESIRLAASRIVHQECADKGARQTN